MSTYANISTNITTEQFITILLSVIWASSKKEHAEPNAWLSKPGQTERFSDIDTQNPNFEELVTFVLSVLQEWLQRKEEERLLLTQQINLDPNAEPCREALNRERANLPKGISFQDVMFIATKILQSPHATALLISLVPQVVKATQGVVHAVSATVSGMSKAGAIRATSKAVPVVALATEVAFRGYEACQTESEYRNGKIDKHTRMESHAGNAGGTIGGTTGAYLGSKGGIAIGAAIGSLVPGAGTALGALGGAFFGALFGYVAGDHVGEKISRTVAKQIW